VSDPLGAVLAGGRSRRYGSAKTLAEYEGRPLIWRPIETLGEAFGTVVVVCKPGTPLPELPRDTAVWYEDDERAHPLVGMVEALRRAEGRRVAVLGCDMPAVTAELMKRLSAATPQTAVARSQDGLEPMAAVYSPDALKPLSHALDSEQSLREAVSGLDPVEVEVTGAEMVNVNVPGELRRLPSA
jgi:molybdopterin-guanine dinucleotide biosynthesis protein A